MAQSDTESLVLVVDGDNRMRQFIRVALTCRGYLVVEADDTSQITLCVATHHPKLVLYDPGPDHAKGIQTLSELRAWYHVPLIAMSERSSEDAKVRVLDAGADDYMTKPSGLNELLARMRVALRHGPSRGTALLASQEIGNLKLDLTRRQLTRDGVIVDLTPIEFKLFTLFAMHAGKVLSHRQILSEVWGPAYESQNHYVRVHIAELRKKIEKDPSRPTILVTVIGVGYRLRDFSSPPAFATRAQSLCI